MLALGFSVFLVFENYVNKDFQDFDVGFTLNNAYDIKYCKGFPTGKSNSRNFILTPSFYVKCRVFESLNVINSLLNNVLFLVISVFIDIVMIRSSSKLAERKRNASSSHCVDVIQFEAKLNKMTIVNGMLFFLSHFPHFLLTLIVFFYKSKKFLAFCSEEYDCSILSEMAQVFHFVSIGFQFFIFLGFDKNFRRSFLK